jgi:hypothetical protein
LIPNNPLESILYEKQGVKTAHFAQFWCGASPLDATLQGAPACVASKGLSCVVSSLDATLTKNTGGWAVMVN